MSNSAIYASKLESHLLYQYHLVFWKSYFQEENTWELASAMLHFYKLISIFHKKHPKKPRARSLVKPITTKQSKSTKVNSTNKYANKAKTFDFDLNFGLFLIVSKRFLSHRTSYFLQMF